MNRSWPAWLATLNHEIGAASPAAWIPDAFFWILHRLNIVLGRAKPETSYIADQRAISQSTWKQPF
jgi:hypothetical protein